MFQTLFLRGLYTGGGGGGEFALKNRLRLYICISKSIGLEIIKINKIK